MDKTGITFGALVAIIGLIVFVAPEASVKVVVILLGAGAVANGFYNLFRVRLLSQDSVYRSTVLTRSIVSIIVGVLAVFLPFAFFSAATAVVRVMLYVLAVYLILSAVAELFFITILNREQIPTRMFATEAASSLLVALVLFLLPANFGLLIIRFLGLALLLMGVCYALYAWKNQSIVISDSDVRDDTDS
ncbi:MAG: DUF308 domain-containing protein [Treponema sp.]|nr:DUF308 domain-containing protein [Treponema sp.]